MAGGVCVGVCVCVFVIQTADTKLTMIKRKIATEEKKNI